jgi:hypothetical protein
MRQFVAGLNALIEAWSRPLLTNALGHSMMAPVVLVI